MILGMDLEPILEKLEDEQPHEGINEARDLLEGDSLSEEEHSRLSYGLATGLFKIGSYHEALEWLERTNSDRRWMLEGFCWMNLKNPSSARRAFLKSAETFSDNRVESLLLAAQALAQTGELEEALQELQRLDSREVPGRVGAEIRLNIGLIHEEQEEFEKAREWFNRVLDDGTEHFNGEAIFHLAVAHEELGQIDQALRQLDRLEDRVDEDSQLREALARARNRLSREEKNRTEQLRQYDF